MFDSHFHIFPAAHGTLGARYVPNYRASFQTWQSEATVVGITHGVLVQPSFLGCDNQLLLKTLTQNNATLRGIVVVTPDVNRDALEQMNAIGVRGIRLNLAGQSHAIPEWSEARHLWEALLHLGWHLEVHTDQGKLPQVLAQLPVDVPLVIDHMGKPCGASKFDESIATLLKRSKQSPVHVKLSGAYRLKGINPKEVSQVWLDELGTDRLLWGSDWPCTNHESEANYPTLFHSLKDWVGEQNLRPVLVTNPQTLYE
jgi:predicted TIM-barrel fold metal-dependent hydrolase